MVIHLVDRKWDPEANTIDNLSVSLEESKEITRRLLNTRKKPSECRFAFDDDPFGERYADLAGVWDIEWNRTRTLFEWDYNFDALGLDLNIHNFTKEYSKLDIETSDLGSSSVIFKQTMEAYRKAYPLSQEFLDHYTAVTETLPRNEHRRIDENIIEAAICMKLLPPKSKDRLTNRCLNSLPKDVADRIDVYTSNVFKLRRDPLIVLLFMLTVLDVGNYGTRIYAQEAILNGGFQSVTDRDVLRKMYYCVYYYILKFV